MQFWGAKVVTFNNFLLWSLTLLQVMAFCIHSSFLSKILANCQFQQKQVEIEVLERYTVTKCSKWRYLMNRKKKKNNLLLRIGFQPKVWKWVGVLSMHMAGLLDFTGIWWQVLFGKGKIMITKTLELISEKMEEEKIQVKYNFLKGNGRPKMAAKLLNGWLHTAKDQRCQKGPKISCTSRICKVTGCQIWRYIEI